MIFSSQMLRVLAQGIDRLNDGDSKDALTVTDCLDQMLSEGYVYEHGAFVPKNEATAGYLFDGTYVWINGMNEWTSGRALVPPGKYTLFFQPEGPRRDPLRGFEVTSG